MLYAWDASKQTMFCKLGVVLCTRQQPLGVCMATRSPVTSVNAYPNINTSVGSFCGSKILFSVIYAACELFHAERDRGEVRRP